MADEVLINRLYDIVDEITRLGGEQERTSITPGILVVNANPSDLPSGYIKIVNPRDGTYVPCLAVNGLVVSDNDLVNVLFTKGTEPIALSQSSQSPSNSLKVSEVWDSGFSAVALAADASGSITVNTGTLTIPSDIIHGGDTDTKISLTDDKISFDAGGLNLLALTETAQNLVEIGDVAGGGDVDININNDQFFVQGSDGAVGIDTNPPGAKLHVTAQTTDAVPFRLTRNTTSITGPTPCARLELASTGSPTADTQFGARLDFFSDNTGGTLGNKAAIIGGVETSNGGFLLFQTTNISNTLTDRMYLDRSGNVGINTLDPQGHIHSYDSISGFLLWEHDGLNATVRTIVPNGTGDVLYRLHAEYVLRDSAGAVASGSTDVSNAASVNLTVGTNTVRLRVNADGSCDTNRTAGSDTIKVAYTLRWL